MAAIMKRHSLLGRVCFRPRVLFAAILCTAGALMALAAFGVDYGILAFGGTTPSVSV
jgi:hypothetical protein